MSSYFSVGLDPPSALHYILKGKNYIIKKKICEATKRSFAEITKYYDQIKKSDFINLNSETNIGQIENPYSIYTLCRVLKPKLVVETGVASGVSSAYILRALEDNGDGRLISIDMPNYAEKLVRENPEYAHVTPKAIIPEGKETGWCVPDILRKKWTLKLGLVEEILIPTLDEVGQIDVFFHDSEHTYKNMMFEFRNAWTHLKSGGILLSHDINWNTSFRDFAKEVNQKYTEIHFTGMGSILK